MDIPLDRLQDPEADVRLVPFEENHVAALAAVFQDAPTLRFYLPSLARPFSEAQLRGLLADWHDMTTDFVFTIVHGGKVAGLCNLSGVDWVNRSAEIGVALLPDGPRGKGVARAAVRLLLGFSFREAGLHRIMARIQDGNDASTRLFEALGFRREGALRDTVRRSGGWRALNVLSLLEDEYRP